MTIYTARLWGAEMNLLATLPDCREPLISGDSMTLTIVEPNSLGSEALKLSADDENAYLTVDDADGTRWGGLVTSVSIKGAGTCKECHQHRGPITVFECWNAPGKVEKFGLFGLPK